MAKSILDLSQMVSEPTSDPDELDPAQSAQIDDDLSDLSTLEKLESQLQKQELLFAQFTAQINSNGSTAGSGKIDGELSVCTTLERLEIQFQKQKLLNAQFSAKIKSNGDCLNSSIQDFRTSLQLIFKELKVMKQAQTNSPQICNNFQSKQGMNPSSEILGSAPQSGNGFATIPQSPSLDHHGFENIHIAPQNSYSQLHSHSNINNRQQTSYSFLHHKSMKLEFHVYNGSGDILAWIKQTKLVFRYYKLPDCENEYKLFDLMLERNDKKISDKAVFIFDPGGSTFEIDGGVLIEANFFYNFGKTELVFDSLSGSNKKINEIMVCQGFIFNCLEFQYHDSMLETKYCHPYENERVVHKVQSCSKPISERKKSGICSQTNAQKKKCFSVSLNCHKMTCCASSPEFFIQL